MTSSSNITSRSSSAPESSVPVAATGRQAPGSWPRIYSPTHNAWPGAYHAAGPRHRKHWTFEELIKRVESAATPRWASPFGSNLEIWTWLDERTDPQSCPLLRQLNRQQIPYGVVSSWKERKWENRLKIKLTAQTAAEANARYMLWMDATDTLLLRSPAHLLNRFLDYQRTHPACEILFAAERNAYPKGDDQKEAVDWELQQAKAADEMPFAHMNTGLIIGETVAIAYWFEEASKQPRSARRPDSDQGVWRRFYRQAEGGICIDRRCELFQVATGKYDPLDVIEIY